MKYIITEINGLETAVLFPIIFDHDEMAYKVVEINKDYLEKEKVLNWLLAYCVRNEVPTR